MFSVSYHGVIDFSTWVDQSKMVEVTIMQFSPYGSPIPLVFVG